MKFDYALEKRFLGESTKGRVQSHLLEESNTEILRKFPAAAEARILAERLRARHRAQNALKNLNAFSWPSFKFATIAALLLLIPVGQVLREEMKPEIVPQLPTQALQTGFRVKGEGARLRIYLKGAREKVTRLEDHATVHGGDLIQLSYTGAASGSGPVQGMILSFDGSGKRTMHLSGSSQTSIALQSQGEAYLPHSFRLDNTPGFERFYLLTSDEPFALSENVQSETELKALLLGSQAIRYQFFDLRKTP